MWNIDIVAYLEKLHQEKKKLLNKETSRGDITRFYKYESSTSATVTIPVRTAKVLSWNHKDRIKMVIKTLEIDGKQHTGIFLFKADL